ncbi:hypothetical protein BESB_068890 [Besnoitia besnoiti]|uniref:Transmembrane protein n=1 Tax=Besnoitia besnoiti TaxID=94643 RepID=A0A2A9MFV2_BESBE|nr:hypothetical protein BESB_068890 [Besnoitia besnoiti]PFH34856.1 hypothetical protein BESB_068890 [Besnoitia besnoiti]
MDESYLPNYGITAAQTPSSSQTNPKTDGSPTAPEASAGAATEADSDVLRGSAAAAEFGDRNSPVRWTVKDVLLKIIFCICLATLVGLIFAGIIFIFDLPQKGPGGLHHGRSHFAVPMTAPTRPEPIPFLQQAYNAEEPIPSVAIIFTAGAVDGNAGIAEGPTAEPVLGTAQEGPG